MAKSKKRNPSRKKTIRPRMPMARTNDKDRRLDQLLTAVRTHPDDIAVRLDLAEHYWRGDQTQKISEVLQGLEQRYPFGDKAIRGRYNVLSAFGHAHRNQLVEAEKSARRGLDEFPEALDFRFVLAFVYLSLREYDRVIDYAEAFIDACDQASHPMDQQMFCSTAADTSQVYNFLGAAYGETDRPAEAEQNYHRAIEADPGNHLPYLNLVRLLNRADRAKEAQTLIEQGLRACRQVQELRLLSASHRKRATVSACMMVKNEEELLPQCLESIRDWVDEIIVVDTGSTDRTIEIAKSYGARIFHHEWDGSFSKHRNQSMEPATGDWIFIIDADECVHEKDVAQIKRLLDQDECRVISINVYNVAGKNRQTKTFLPSVRFFKRELGLKYEGIVHNLLKVPPEEPIMRAGVRIIHYGYGLSAQRMKVKFERSRALLEKQIEEDPNNYHAHFNYAQLLRGQGLNDHPEFGPMIFESAQKAIGLTDPEHVETRHIHLMALHQTAWFHFVTGDYAEACAACFEALKHKSNYLDPLLLLGHIYLKDQHFDKAEESYLRYLEVQSRFDPSRETDSIILLHPESRESAYYGLGAIAFEAGRFDDAAEHYRNVLEACPGFLDTDIRLGWTYLKLHRLQEAEVCFQRTLDADATSAEAVMGLADVHYRRQDFERTEQLFRRSLDLCPDHGGIMTKFGEFLLEKGDYQHAADLFQKSIDCGHDGAKVRLNLANTCFKMGQYAQAAEVYRPLVERGEGGAETINDLGNCYFKSGDYEEAERQYQKALELDDGLVTAYRNLGLVQTKLGKPDQAVALLEKYLQLNPEDGGIYLALGGLHADLGNWDAAIGYYERFLQASPTDPLALFGLSECYFRMGHQESAILGYRQVLALDADFQPARDRLGDISRAVEQV